MNPASPSPLLGAVDVHAHFLPPRYRASALAHGQRHPDGMPALPEWSVSGALETMDRTGIAAAALSISSPGLAFLNSSSERVALAAAINEDGAAAVSEHPQRFALLANLPLPDVRASLAEINHAYDVCGADGVGLHTHTDGVYLGDARLDPIMAALDERAAVIAVHPTSPCGWEEVAFGRPRPLLEFLFDTTRAVVNLALTGAFARYPRIRWIIPHAGAALPVVADRVHALRPPQDKLETPDIDVVATLRGLHYDLAGVPLPRALPALLGLTGPSHLLYGSDYPFTPPERVRQFALALTETPVFDATSRLAVFRTNALELFPRLAS